jgi:hypothetical protein
VCGDWHTQAARRAPERGEIEQAPRFASGLGPHAAANGGGSSPAKLRVTGRASCKGKAALEWYFLKDCFQQDWQKR